MSKSKAPRQATGRNLEFKMAMMEIGRSNATAPRKPRTERRQGTRRAQIERAKKEW